MPASALEYSVTINGVSVDVLSLLGLSQILGVKLDAIEANTANRIVLDADREQAVLPSVTDAAEGTQAFAAIAGQKHHLSHIHLCNNGATDTAVEVLDGATVVDVLYVAGKSPGGANYPVPPIVTANTRLALRKRDAGALIEATVLAYRTAA